MPGLVRVLLVLALLAGGKAWWDWRERAVRQSPGILAATAPLQRDFTKPPTSEQQGYQLKHRADFQVHARVLSKRRYRWGRESELSPVDLALGWGPMSDTLILEQLEISQGNRWYIIRYQETPPLPIETLLLHSANMHIIPANQQVRETVLRLRPGQVVELQGKLVDVEAADGFRWNTSLRRDDSGNGACELFLVEKLLHES